VRNSATVGWGTTVSGGIDNTASADFAAVGGGYMNQAGGGDGATIGGGVMNVANNEYATVGGGERNEATGRWATVSGGRANAASGYIATVGGGGTLSTPNIASGDGATIPGGLNNTAQGDYSFAAGLRAKALHNGAFVWADSTDADLESTDVDQFLIRAAGGVGIGTSSPDEELHVVGNTKVEGTLLATSSDPTATTVSGIAPGISGIGVYGSSTGTSGKGIFGSALGESAYAGYFLGGVHVSGDVGVGTTDPAGNRLKVAGNLDTTTLSVADDGSVHNDLTVGNTGDYSTSNGRLTVATAAPNWVRPLMIFKTAAFGDIKLIHDGGFALRNGHIGDTRDEILTVRNAGDDKNLIVYGNGDAEVRGTLTELSDRRLKTEVDTIPNAVAKVKSLRGVCFKWRARNDQTPRMGVVAQEVESVVPEAVFTASDRGGTKHVAYSALVALLVEANKAQQRDIEALRAEHAATQAQLEALEALIRKGTEQETPSAARAAR